MRHLTQQAEDHSPTILEASGLQSCAQPFTPLRQDYTPIAVAVLRLAGDEGRGQEIGKTMCRLCEKQGRPPQEATGYSDSGAWVSGANKSGAIRWCNVFSVFICLLTTIGVFFDRVHDSICHLVFLVENRTS